MNVRFAEPCRVDALSFLAAEDAIQITSSRDGRDQKDLALRCEKDIFLGVFFDGTNNNKYRDRATLSHSNVARLFEVFPGKFAKQTMPKLKDRINPDGSTTPREIEDDQEFKASSVPPDDYPYYRKIYIPGVGTPMPDVRDSGTDMQKKLGLAMAAMSQIRLEWARVQVLNQIHAAIFGAPLAPSVELTAKKFWTRSNLHPVDPKESPVDTAVRVQTGEAFHRAIVEGWDEFDVATGAYEKPQVEALYAEYEKRLLEQLAKRGNNKPHIRKIRLSVFGFSRGAAQARAWINMLLNGSGSRIAGIPLQIDFLGLFDTVASVGLSQAIPHSNGHYSWAAAENMIVPDSVKRCVHLVAAFEVRGSFPLDSVCQGDALPSNCKEIVYPGVHSDVGGGYPPENQGRALGAGRDGDKRKISQIALAQMYREARMAGVPLAPKKSMLAFRQTDFEIDASLRDDFNAYVAATRMDDLPPTKGAGGAQYSSMYPTETQPRETLDRVISRHYGHMLQWRRALLNTSGGAAGLAGLAASGAVSATQDKEDFRGAEEELRKEIAFLEDSHADKFYKVDDKLLDKLPITKPMKLGEAAVKLITLIGKKKSPWRIGFAAAHYVVMYGVTRSLQQVMQEKQLQWDLSLRNVWYGAGALSRQQAEAAKNLFEKYVHDSRAWFKPMARSDADSFELTPDDEEWFVLGVRDATFKKEVAEMRAEIQKLKAKGEAFKAQEKQHKLDAVEKAGYVLLVGGREPYRMGGYVRHRRLYRSGVLMAHRANPPSHVLDREEIELRRERMLAQEKERHEAALQEIRNRSRATVTSSSYGEETRQEMEAASGAQIGRENKFHKEQVERISAGTAH